MNRLFAIITIQNYKYGLILARITDIQTHFSPFNLAYHAHFALFDVFMQCQTQLLFMQRQHKRRQDRWKRQS